MRFVSHLTCGNPYRTFLSLGSRVRTYLLVVELYTCQHHNTSVRPRAQSRFVLLHGLAASMLDALRDERTTNVFRPVDCMVAFM